MKVAICGGGPLAIEMAAKLYSIEAYADIISLGELGGELNKVLPTNRNLLLAESWDKLLSPWGKDLLKNKKFDQIEPTIENYLNEYLWPLIEVIKLKNQYKVGEVIQVHKRYLSYDEEISGKGRMHDLFRVIYKKEMHAIQDNDFLKKFNDPQLTQDVQDGVELHIDCDLVVQATGRNRYCFLGPAGGYALGEQRALKTGLIYNKRRQIDFSNKLNDLKSIAIVGSDLSALETIVMICSWAKDDRLRKLIFISKEEKPFEAFRQKESQNVYIRDLLERFDQFWGEMKIQNENDQKDFIHKKEQWDQLDDFIKVKMPRPKQPESQFQFWGGCVVGAVDYLLDRQQLYLTLEFPPFLEQEFWGVNIENNHRRPEIVTLGVDAAFCATGRTMQLSAYEYLRSEYFNNKIGSLSLDGIHSEPGFYTLGPIQNKSYDIYSGINQIPLLISDMMKFFQRR